LHKGRALTQASRQDAYVTLQRLGRRLFGLPPEVSKTGNGRADPMVF